MLSECKECPGSQPLVEHLRELVGDNSEVSFKQWESTDRTTLHQKTLKSQEFISTLVEKIVDLKFHHFVSKEQAKFFRDLKENLPENTCILQGDFSQNYSMVTQSSAQGSFFV